MMGTETDALIAYCGLECSRCFWLQKDDKRGGQGALRNLRRQKKTAA